MNEQAKHDQGKAFSVKDKVSAAEWQTRVDLAAAYRLVAAYGWDDLVFTHISARVPDSDHQFLINPYGMLFEEVTASSLVKIDLHGKKVMESPFDINPAGFVIHSAIHAAREDAHCVMHLHTPAGVAVACQKGGLLPISQQSLFVLASLAYHGYEGVALNDAEKPRLVNDLGANTFLILPNHGLLTVGGSIADAFLAMYTMQRACEIQVLAQSGGGDLIPIPKPILDGAAAQRAQVTRGLGGALAWPGLMRKLDRRDAGYRM
ncbi:class II aldolase/adducin family protein [Roseiarcus sp.]|uniref:class II aldolase/adducin family protein n=1 Tax=Roseiarcus sp. TaxID=1969460 RepID=UPI003C4B17AB